jgi:hypothetical protein
MGSKAAVAAAILLLAGPSRAAPAARHVFFIDRVAIENRYLGVAQRDEASGADGIRAVDSDLAAAAARVAPAHGGNVVLERGAFVFARREADLTALVEAEMDKARTPVPGAPAVGAAADVAALADPAIVVADLEKVRTTVPNEGTLEANITRALAALADQRHADLVMGRRDTVMGLIDVDITGDLVGRLTGAKMGLIGPLATPRISVVDRYRVLQGSLVGKSLVEQVHALTDATVADIQKRAAALPPNASHAPVEREAQEREAAIRKAFFAARATVENKLGPILQGLMQGDHVDLLLERSAVPFDSVDPDLTDRAIRKLDAALPTVPLKLAPPPR